MGKYIYQHKNWPNFVWDALKLSPLLIEVRSLQARLLGRMDILGFQLRQEASLQVLTQDVVKTSEIEGERFDTEQVRSSIAKRLGIETGAALPADRHVDGIVEMLLDATQEFQQPLTEERLFSWHAVLFPTGRSGFRRIVVGEWRTKESGPMRVLSGPFGREKIHFEAPDASDLKKEMTVFIKWFNTELQDVDPVIKAGIAHFWFVTIHPFEDGNGRIARAIADMQLARSEKCDQRFYSMSSQIQQERHAYYDVLEACQQDGLDITVWLEWFLNCLKRAIVASDSLLQKVLTKAQFWTQYKQDIFNPRQHEIINLLLDDFYGKLTSSKWAKITKCSQDTALRDINNLLERGILVKEEGGGRSTSYHLK
ncbi:MAG: Fic family protein [Gammaproteobacteria bacterium]